MTTTFTCPKGHSSADNDFCSECGAKIQGAAAPSSISQSVSQTVSGSICPDCGAPIAAAGVNFCEICGYNFVTHASGQFPSPLKPSPAPQAPPQPVSPTVAETYELIITVDATLRTAASPEAPTDTLPVTYPLDKPVNLIGRKSAARAIFPEIAVDNDSAISHRHGIISQTAEGLLIYRDLESSNGTRLNGTDVAPLTDTPLKTGDQLTLGHWTRITVTPHS